MVNAQPMVNIYLTSFLSPCYPTSHQTMSLNGNVKNQKPAYLFIKSLRPYRSFHLKRRSLQTRKLKPGEGVISHPRASMCNLSRNLVAQQDWKADSLAPRPAFSCSAPLPLSSSINVLHFLNHKALCITSFYLFISIWSHSAHNGKHTLCVKCNKINY